MSSSQTVIPKNKKDVKESFQKLDYLKNVPKRIDCWLTKDNDKSMSKDPQSCKNKKNQNQKFLNQTYETGSLLEKSPKIMGKNMKLIEDFTDFTNSVKNKIPKSGRQLNGKSNIIDMSREFNNLARLNDSEISYDSANLISVNKSQNYPLKLKNAETASQALRSSNQRRGSLFSNEGE